MKLFPNVLNILLVVAPTLEQGWSLELRLAQVNKFPPKRQDTKRNRAPLNTCDCFGPADPDSWKSLQVL